MKITELSAQRDINCCRSFLLDMDGTIYLGDRLFPETKPFLEKLESTGREYIFLTNNSSKNGDAYVEKLARLGIETTRERVFTSGEATVVTLSRETPGAKVCLLGTKALRDEFEDAGFTIDYDKPDIVVLGFDQELTYDRLRRACRAISLGAPYVATHADLVCPVDGEPSIPDAGSMIELIRATTGRVPRVIGKPNRPIAEAIEQKYGFSPETTVMVGDRLYTDVAMGKTAGIRSALVLSGETSLRDYESQSEYEADFVYKDVGELADSLR